MGIGACPHGVDKPEKCETCRMENDIGYTENPNALTPEAARGGEHDLRKE